MAKPKSKPAPSPSAAVIDPSSPEIVLEYSGGPTPRHVPARNLSGNDLARILYQRAAAATRGSRSRLIKPGEERAQPTRPGPATAAELERLATELSSTGSFARSFAGAGTPPIAVEGITIVETEGEPADAITTDESIPPPAAPAPEPEA